MSTDATISADLAALGQLSVGGPPLDHLLGQFDHQVRRPFDACLLRDAATFTRRVGIAAAGAAFAIVSLATVLVMMITGGGGSFVDELSNEFSSAPFGLATLTLGCGSLAYVVAERAAALWFLRRLAASADPLALSRALVKRGEAPTLAASILGVTSFVLLIGMLRVVLGNTAPPVDVGEHVAPARLFALISLLVLFAATIPAAGFVARRAGRLDVRVVFAALAVLFVTVAVGRSFDIGSLWDIWAEAKAPSYALRTALTVTGSLSVFALVTAWATWRQRTDEGRSPATDR